MLKFDILTPKAKNELTSRLSSGVCFDDVDEIVSSFMPSVADGCEIGFARVGETLLVRIFDDGEYIFIYPIALAMDADERKALDELRRYAVREEIPLLIYDLPEESVPTLEAMFRYTAITECEDGLIAEVKSELKLLCESPFATDGEISLSPLTEEDIPRYADISKNESLNKYWGYDYREDMPKPDDEYFYKAAKRGFDDGVSLSLGVRFNGELIGEGCFWGFDFLGGAEIGFKILPKWQSRGFGGRTLELLIKLGDEMGLLNLYATVKKENLPSCKLLDSKMKRCSEENGVYKYIHEYKT